MYNTVPARTPPKSPSGRSIWSSLSCSSSRESSPCQQFSAATSLSNIDQDFCSGDSERQGHFLMVMEHHNHSFDSPNSLRNRIRTIEPDDASSSLCNTASHSNERETSTSSANSRIEIGSGNHSGGLLSNRSLTSANWRNTNTATSHDNRGSFILLPSYNNNESNISQLHPFYENLNQASPDLTRTMSSPTSPPAHATPADPRAAQGSNDTGNNNNISTVCQNDSKALAHVQASKAMTQITAQQQQQQHQQGGGRGAGQTDMPYYAYCLDRGNGQYTRLIPADMLPPLVDIPALQQGCMGMTVLPCPTGLAPNGRSSNLERVFLQVKLHTIMTTC